MRAAVFNTIGEPFDIEARPDPVPGEGEMVIKVERCGVCGSDLHMTSGHGGITFPAGSVIGHEYSGEIVELGKGVEGFKVGQRVTAIPCTGCGHCEACVAGHPILCPSMRGMSGGYAEYCRVAASSTIVLPEALSMEDGALCEPLAVGLHGVAMGRLQPGARVVVLGAGAVALAAIFWARRMGAGRIVAVSRSLRRADLALAMGADEFVVSGDDEVERIRDALGGGADVVYECVGVPGQLGLGVKLARTNGRVVSLGFCTAPDPVVPSALTFKQVSLHFSMHFTLRELQHVADTLSAGHVEPRLMITDRVSLYALPAAIERLRGPNEDTKVQVMPWL